MKLKLSRKAFTLVLAVLIGAAMTPCVLHAQSQSSTTTSTTTTKAQKRAAKRAAKKQARAEKKAAKANTSAENKTAAAPSSAAASTNTAAAKSRSRHETASNAQSATPPQPGMVWVNTSTHVYHKAGSRWAGKTKSGKWMSEADAQKAGYKAAKN